MGLVANSTPSEGDKNFDSFMTDLMGEQQNKDSSMVKTKKSYIKTRNEDTNNVQYHSVPYHT